MSDFAALYPRSGPGGSGMGRSWHSRVTITDVVVVFPTLLVFALIGLFPFLWAFLTSIKLPVDAFAMPPVMVFKPTLAAYGQLLRDAHFADYLWNSCVVSAGVVLISTIVGCLAGYGLARYSGMSSLLLLALTLILYAVPCTAVLLLAGN